MAIGVGTTKANFMGGFFPDGIFPNIANVPSADLRQKISIDETSSGNWVLIKGAKITEISYLASTTTSTTTSTSTATSTGTLNLLTVSVFGQSYKIKVEGDTNVVRYYWGKSAMDLSEFSVGDIVNVYGTLDSSDPFLIHAKTLRNVSIQQKHVVKTGTVQSITSSTNSFIIQNGKNVTTTVNTDSNTKIYKGKDLKAFSDIEVGAKVSVRGLWDKNLAKIQALLVRILSK